MKRLLVFIFLLVLMTAFTDTSPILTEKEAKQILRTRREDRRRKAGFPDEPMRYILHSRQKGGAGVSGQRGDRDLFMGTEEDTDCDYAKDKIITALAECSL